MSLEPSTAAAESRGDRLRGAAPAGLAGIGAAALGVGLGELAAAFLQTTASPIVAVGALLIDLAPPWAKDTAIALFGTADKIALIALVAVVLLVVAAVAGVLERRRPPWGRVLIGLIAAIGAVAVATRTPFSPLDTVPPLLAMVVAVLTLQFLAKTLFVGRAVRTGTFGPADLRLPANLLFPHPTDVTRPVPDDRDAAAWRALLAEAEVAFRPRSAARFYAEQRLLE